MASLNTAVRHHWTSKHHFLSGPYYSDHTCWFRSIYTGTPNAGMHGTFRLETGMIFLMITLNLERKLSAGQVVRNTVSHPFKFDDSSKFLHLGAMSSFYVLALTLSVTISFNTKMISCTPLSALLLLVLLFCFCIILPYFNHIYSPCRVLSTVGYVGWRFWSVVQSSGRSSSKM